MRISDWSSDVCSSDLQPRLEIGRVDGGDDFALFYPVVEIDVHRQHLAGNLRTDFHRGQRLEVAGGRDQQLDRPAPHLGSAIADAIAAIAAPPQRQQTRSEEHTSELQSQMRISYAV